jgi:hypothetical protein
MLCLTHDTVILQQVPIVYGLLEPGAYEAEAAAGKVILGSCCDGEWGESGFVCPVDGARYVIQAGQLKAYKDANGG